MKIFILNCSPVRDGATAEIARIAGETLAPGAAVRAACIDDYAFAFCRGCRACHATGRCVQRDGVDDLMADLDESDRVIFVSPSYWADVPAQMKAWIDRCTPWSNTHEPHAALAPGKRAYAIVLRTGPGMRECQRLLETLRHFWGHLALEDGGALALCSVARREDVAPRAEEIRAFCRQTVLRP